MQRPSSQSVQPTTLHTAIIGDAGNMWSKLAWDADVCRDVQISYPSEQQPLAYAAINVCIAAWSLRNWVEGELIRRARTQGAKFDIAAHRVAMNTAVPEQAMCEAIANTAKHARHEDGGWPGGQVSLDWQEGDEDCPEGFELRHLNGDGGGGALAVNSFHALCENWWKFLNTLGLAQEVPRTPEWQQNKLRRIFGDPADLVLPPGCVPLNSSD